MTARLRGVVQQPNLYGSYTLFPCAECGRPRAQGPGGLCGPCIAADLDPDPERCLPAELRGQAALPLRQSAGGEPDA